MPKQSEPQKKTMKRVMHEYKDGELKAAGNGKKVTSRKQAVAIALHESGSTNQESPKANERNLRRTKAKEARGQTAEAATEGRAAQAKTMHSAARRKRSSGSLTRKELYAKARQQHIPGRSKMTKAQLSEAVH